MVIRFQPRSGRPVDSQTWKAWQELGARLRRLLAMEPARASKLVSWVQRLFDEVDRH